MASCISNGRCEKKIAVSMAKKYMTHMNTHSPPVQNQISKIFRIRCWKYKIN